MPPLSQPPAPKAGMIPPPPVGGGAGLGMSKKGEMGIVVMPEKYYGLAAKMDGKTQAELEAMAAKSAAPPPPKPVVPVGPVRYRPIWPVVLIFVILVLLVGGGYIWFNRKTLFQPPTPSVVVEPEPTPRVAPNAPANLVAVVTTGTSPAVTLTWVGGGGETTGFRLDRREGDGTFLPLTPLPANATSFLDVTVRLGRTYQYRVFSTGPGGESSSSNLARASVAEGVPILTTPSLPPGGLDSDSDGLSDVEEMAYGTDLRVPDTDRDGFLDGNEVFNLYNPAAVAPVRLLDSDLVVPFVSPAGWSVYVPKEWTMTLDENNGSKATIRTGQGEIFHLSIEDNPNHAALAEWYATRNPSVVPSQLREILTKGGLKGLLGPDRMDAHFAWDENVFVLRYDLGEKTYIQFRTTYEMMLNSLRLSGAPVLTQAEAPVLEGPGEFLSTTSVTPNSP